MVWCLWLCACREGPSVMKPDSVLWSDQLLQETGLVDQWNQKIGDFTGPLHWFPVATDGIVGLSPIVDRGLWGWWSNQLSRETSGADQWNRGSYSFLPSHTTESDGGAGSSNFSTLQSDLCDMRATYDGCFVHQRICRPLPCSSSIVSHFLYIVSCW